MTSRANPAPGWLIVLKVIASAATSWGLRLDLYQQNRTLNIHTLTPIAGLADSRGTRYPALCMEAPAHGVSRTSGFLLQDGRPPLAYVHCRWMYWNLQGKLCM